MGILEGNSGPTLNYPNFDPHLTHYGPYLPHVVPIYPMVIYNFLNTILMMYVGSQDK